MARMNDMNPFLRLLIYTYHCFDVKNDVSCGIINEGNKEEVLKKCKRVPFPRLVSAN